LRKKKENKKIYVAKKQKFIIWGVNLTHLFMKKKLNFHETGIGCGQSFILTKNIMATQSLFL